MENMRIYLDTNIVAAIGKDDTPQETEALSIVLRAFDRGLCELCTSAVTGHEIAAYHGKRSVEWVYRILTKVPYVVPWTLGCTVYVTPGGLATRDESEQDPIWAKLRTLGLDDFDAHHVMEAVRGECQIFLTCDRAVLRRAQQIQEALLIRVSSPSQLANEPAFQLSE